MTSNVPALFQLFHQKVNTEPALSADLDDQTCFHKKYLNKVGIGIIGWSHIQLVKSCLIVECVVFKSWSKYQTVIQMFVRYYCYYC